MNLYVVRHGETDMAVERMPIKTILFNTEMVLAILDGRKSCTRRIMKPQLIVHYGTQYAMTKL